ncbi:YceI family protein [Aquihabitans sp. McL0605]|uniref:YceI family protein n=1 Tax=Aquihabitans sp. McL0605 TaxID=3415671 RepID=UPI003CF15075
MRIRSHPTTAVWPDDRPNVLDEAHRVPSPGTYLIDPDRTVVEFVARHLVVARVHGQFRGITGTVTVDDVPERSGVEATIDATTVDTGIPARDKHLRSADFFDVERFPTISFRSTALEPGTAPRQWILAGLVDVLGSSQPVRLVARVERAWESAAGRPSISVSASTVVDRESWGLTWNARAETGGLLIGPMVDVNVLVQAVTAT